MDMKAMMFAGGGLFLAMVATTMMMSGDVARMREKERAIDAQKCAMAQQAQQDTSAAALTSPAPAPAVADPNFAPAPAADSIAEQCANQAAANGTSGAIDPVTGQPVATTPTSGAIDPVTGQPLDSSTGAIPPPADSQSFAPASGNTEFNGATDPAVAGGTTGATGGF